MKIRRICPNIWILGGNAGTWFCAIGQVRRVSFRQTVCCMWMVMIRMVMVIHHSRNLPTPFPNLQVKWSKFPIPAGFGQFRDVSEVTVTVTVMVRGGLFYIRLMRAPITIMTALPNRKPRLGPERLPAEWATTAVVANSLMSGTGGTRNDALPPKRALGRQEFLCSYGYGSGYT